MFDVKKYNGDDNFRRILKDNNAAVDIYSLKAAILGMQASAGTISLKIIAHDYFGKKALSNEAVDQLESLWFHLLRLQRCSDEEIEQPDFNNKTRDAYTGYVSSAVMRAETFLRYLHTGHIEDMRKNQKIDKVYSILVGNIHLLKSLEMSMAQQWKHEDFANDTAFLNKLAGFIRVLWDTQVALKEHAKVYNLQKLNNKNIISAIELQTGSEIKRNDPCPCGSGKKYKNCCAL